MTEQAKEIRKQLKEVLGLNNKKVSVKSDLYAVWVRVKDLSVDLNLVKDLVSKYESIDRCQRTGEILEGGNSYVFVEYA